MSNDERPVRFLVHLFTDIIIYRFSQEKATQKPPPSGEQPEAAPQSESGPPNAPDDMKPEPSSVQHVVEVMVSFMPSEVEAHMYSCSADLKNHRTIFLV